MNNREPLYMTIMQILKERIINGDYPLYSLVPTENDLEEEFQVSKVTIRKAVEMLEREGYVQKRSGKGTTVLSNAIFNKLSKGSTFSQLLITSGRQLRKEKTHISVMNLEPTDELYTHFKKSCTKINRVYYLDGEPFMYYTYYLPSHLDIPPIEDDDKFSIYMTLFKNGYLVKRLRDEFYIDYPSLKILEALHLENGPLLGRKRTTYDENDRVIEISIAQYNTRLSNYIIDFDV